MSIYPESPMEQVLYAVKRVEASDGTNVSVGTGWILELEIDPGKTGLIMLMTNRHVVENYATIDVEMHLKNDDYPTPESVKIRIDSKNIIYHDHLDVCAILLGPAINTWYASNPGKSFYFVTLNKSIFLSRDMCSDLDVCEPVVMVGCPSGMWDDHNKLPLFRHGFTASHPAVDFGGKKEVAIDIGVFSGSSGSPVFLFKQGLQPSTKRGGDLMPVLRFALIGMLWGGPRILENGDIVAMPAPTSRKFIASTGVRMHLGYVIKAEAVLKFAEEIADRLRAQQVS